MTGPGAIYRSLRARGRRLLIRRGVRADQVTIKRQRRVGSAEYARRAGATWQVVRVAETPDRVAPVRYGQVDADFEATQVPIPDLGVLTLRDGVVVGPAGLAVTPDGFLLDDSSFWHGRTQNLPDAARRGTVRRVRGTLVSIASAYAGSNYGHFLLDSLPRIALLEQAGIRIADADHIYVAVPSAYAARLLDVLDLPTDRRLIARRGIAVRADTTVVTSFPGSRRNYPRWHVAFLRDRLGVPAAAPSRRLYIPRHGHRQIQNIDDLMPMLLEHGFEVFDPLAGEDPRHAFAEAEAVVGGHGAGLADLAFCRPGTRVLELLPMAHRRPFYMTLSGSADLRYGYLIGQQAPDSDAVSTIHRAYVIDPDEFRIALEATLG